MNLVCPITPCPFSYLQSHFEAHQHRVTSLGTNLGSIPSGGPDIPLTPSNSRLQNEDPSRDPYCFALTRIPCLSEHHAMYISFADELVRLRFTQWF